MKLPVLLSIVLLSASAHGLFLKKAALKKKLPAIQSVVSGLASSLGGAGIEAGASSDAESSVRFVGAVAVPATVYYEAPVQYYREVRQIPVVRQTVYVRASNPTLADVKSSLTGLISGSSRAIGGLGSTIKQAVGSVLGSSGSASARISYSSF